MQDNTRESESGGDFRDWIVWLRRAALVVAVPIPVIMYKLLLTTMSPRGDMGVAVAFILVFLTALVSGLVVVVLTLLLYLLSDSRQIGDHIEAVIAVFAVLIGPVLYFLGVGSFAIFGISSLWLLYTVIIARYLLHKVA